MQEENHKMPVAASVWRS